MSEFKKTTKKPVTNLLISVMTGIIVFIFLSSLSSIIMLNVNIEKNYLFLLNYFISALSIFVSALISAHKSTNKKLINGFITGIILIILFLLIYLSFNKYSFSLKLILIIPISFVFCFIGCVTGINMKRK